MLASAGTSLRRTCRSHLNLCEGRPLTRGATLTDANGKFPRKGALAARALVGKLSLP